MQKCQARTWELQVQVSNKSPDRLNLTLAASRLLTSGWGTPQNCFVASTGLNASTTSGTTSAMVNSDPRRVHPDRRCRRAVPSTAATQVLATCAGGVAESNYVLTGSGTAGVPLR